MKKILALVLIMLLVFSSFPITAFASEPGEADIPLEIEEDAGIPLEMEEIDPSTLHVKKLGLIEEDEAPEIEEMTYQPGDIVRVSIFLEGDSVADAGYSLDGVGYREDAIMVLPGRAAHRRYCRRLPALAVTPLGKLL